MDVNSIAKELLIDPKKLNNYLTISFRDIVKGGARTPYITQFDLLNICDYLKVIVSLDIKPIE